MNARHRISAVLLVMLGLTVSPISSANPVDVSYVATGDHGDWTLDFSVSNHLTPSTMAVYFFGVQLSQADVVSSPATFSYYSSSWDNILYGGSATVYNNTWLDNSFGSIGGILPGETRNGFRVHITDFNVPASVNWYAYGYAQGDLYSGSGNFNALWNPGFEGIARPSAVVPEPETWALFGGGMLALALVRRRRS